MKYFMGIDVGGTKIAYGLFDENKSLVFKEKIPSDDQKEPLDFFGQVAEKLLEYEKKAKDCGGTLAGVGIGVPGFVDFEKGIIARIPSLPKLDGFNVSQFLKRQLCLAGIEEIPVVVDNDGHCGALAEYRQGAGQGHKNMLYCPVSTGISTGMILDGSLFRGSNGASGESGHMLTCIPEEEQIPCMCGNSGCFNSMGSGKAILTHIRRWLAEGESSMLPELACSVDKITAKHINEAYEKGDPLSIRAVEQMAHYLAVWIFNVYMLLNVDCIVFEGGLLAMGDKLFGRIQEEFERYHTNGFPVEFHFTKLGEDSGLIGAMELLF